MATETAEQIMQQKDVALKVRIITSTGKEAFIPEAALEEFKKSLRGKVIYPKDADYDQARKIYNAMIDKRPALIARCAGAADVVASVNFARKNNLLVAVHGAGHNVAGNSVCEGGIVIDLSAMKGIRIDLSERTARVEPGLTWGEVSQELQTFGLAATGGFVSTTGVSGLTLGGGLGWLLRKHGLAIDNLLSVDVVTADGRLLSASATKNEDLFWGVRGGGGNFGIVTSFEFKVHPAGIVLAGMVLHPVTKGREALRFWRDFAVKSPEEFTEGALLFNAPAELPLPDVLHQNSVLGLGGVYTGSLETGEEALRPLRQFGPPAADIIQPMPYSIAQTLPDFLWPRGFHNYWKSSFLNELSDGAIDTILEFYTKAPSRQTVVVIEHTGNGAMNRIGDDETAFGHRDCPFNFLITSVWTDPKDSEANIKWTREFWEAMKPYMTEAVYVNYMGDEGEERIKSAYGEEKYNRLVTLKKKYDPTNLFCLNQNIKP